MSLDGGFLHIVKTEILEKIPIGARIDKIHQPSRDEVILSFRAGGAYKRILLSANAMSARVCMTETAPDNPAVPPMFCVMLRKHIGNGRLTGIVQDGLERILNFDFTATDELGDTVNNRLIIEVMGRTSNIILINKDNNADNGGKIIDCIKRVTHEISKSRLLLPGLEYIPPQRDLSRHCLLDCEIDNIEWELYNAQALLKMLEGVSPIFTREAVERDNTAEFLKQAKAVLTGEAPAKITLVSDLNGKPYDFCFMPIEQYGSAMTVSRAKSANELLDSFFKEKANVERIKQRSGNIMKTLNSTYERLQRKIETQKLELIKCKDREHLRIYGDLINANLYSLDKGATSLETEDYTTGENVKIKLDPRYTPAQNAQKYYSSYRKLNTAEKMLTKLITESEQELVYLDTVIDAASRAVTDAEIDAIRIEIGKPPSKGKKQSKPKPLSPLKFSAIDGTEILVGRNNKQNDELTFKIAKPDDIWLHTKDMAGSHVILRCAGKNPSAEVITEAAVIAAEHSKGRDSSRVPVDYTFARFVKKPSGSKPGYVIFTNNKTLYVTPENGYNS